MMRHLLHAWVLRAAREFGWRDVALAAGLVVLYLAFGNSGGYLFVSLSEGDHLAIFDPAKTYGKTFLSHFLGQILPLVYLLRVAELAITDGARPWRAYLVVLVAVIACWMFFLLVVQPLLPLGRINRSPEHVGRILWHFLTAGGRTATLLVVYALFRASQRATERVRASEAARVRDLQRLQSAELLALQARVDPQLLFDALARIGLLHRGDPSAANTLLAYLITLLRAMLPRIGSTGSTVEREFSVVEAWLRVTQPPAGAADGAAHVQVLPATDALHASIAPMLVLPLVRAVLGDAAGRRFKWLLRADGAGSRLHVTLDGTAAPSEAVAAFEGVEFDRLRERLALLHGDAARLWIVQTPPRLSLDLPLGDDEAVAAGRATEFAA